MNQKSNEQKANEFTSKSIVKKHFNDLTLSEFQKNLLKNFFKKYQQNFPGEIKDSTYNTIAKMLYYRDDINDLYREYIDLKNTKKCSYEHFIKLYGQREGHKKYHQRSKNISKKNSYKDSEKINKFLNKKCVLGKISKKDLNYNQLYDLDRLLKSRNYSDFKDNEEIIVDLLLNYEPNLKKRYDQVKSLNPSSFEYFQARYGPQAEKKYNERYNKKLLNAKRTLKNIPSYWQYQGYSDNKAIEYSYDIQKKRSEISKYKCKEKPSPRSTNYWINLGYSIEEANKIIYKIQKRDLDFYILKYGEDLGHKKFQDSKVKRQHTWNQKSQLEKDHINSKKGKTFNQLSETHGYHQAREIIKSRTKHLNGISEESKIFFKSLENILPEYITEKSVTGFKTPEKWIFTNNQLFFVDYCVKNCIIEYNGSFWHADSRLFNDQEYHSTKKVTAKEIWKNDQDKVDCLKHLGYNVLIIWSIDVHNNFDQEIQKCKEFLIANISNSD